MERRGGAGKSTMFCHGDKVGKMAQEHPLTYKQFK